MRWASVQVQTEQALQLAPGHVDPKRQLRGAQGRVKQLRDADHVIEAKHCNVRRNSQTLASLGLELSDYDQMVGSFYDGALDPKVMGRTLCAVRSMFAANNAPSPCG